MNQVPTFLKMHAARLTAFALIFSLYGFTQVQLPQLPEAERSTLAGRFSFASSALPELAGYTQKTVRTVSPSLERISAWISSVGASVAINDLDADGLANDVCHVDVRIDQVVVSSAPGTPQRYSAFALDPAPLRYDATMAPMGCLPGDLNEDGLTDILVYYWGRTPIAFLRQAVAPNSGLDATAYLPQEIVAGEERWFTNAATRADLDGDGHIDLVIGNYFQDGAHILDASYGGQEEMQHSMSRAYNGGKKHLLLWTGATEMTTGGAGPSVQFKDFPDVLDAEVAHGWTLAVGAADLDGDMLPEVYFANDFGPDRLMHNRSTPGQPAFARLDGVKGFTTPNSKTLGRDSFKSMGIDFGDLNGDGYLDMFVNNITTPFALEESNFAWVSTGETSRMREGVAPYIDKSEQLGLSRGGWGWESRLADFDNDGVLEALEATGFVKGEINRWPDLQEVATGNDQLLSDPGSWPHVQPGDDLDGHQPNLFFVRAADGRYYDLAQDLRIDQHHVTRGIATADVDGDGKLDFAVANQWEASYFYQNKSAGTDAFLGLHLLLPVGTQTAAETRERMGHPGGDMAGSPAIGASAVVHLPDGRNLVAQVDGGSGHSGKRSSDLQFGLGQTPADATIRVDLSWRDKNGQVQQATMNLTPGWHTVLLGR
ncbi:MAG: CRTAC1 family protein [Chloroflexia bacterium]